jgi:putative membrane protein
MKRVIMLLCACLLVGGAIASVAGARAHVSRSTKASGLDKEYLKTSMEGDLFEIIGGQLAKAKSHNSMVRKLAARLITDHTKSFNDAKKIAVRLGLAIPKDPTPSQQWELKVLGTMSGRTFNHWYSSLEVYDHHQDIQETTDEIQDGSNQAVRDDAKTELPTLKQHLKLSEAALTASP